MKRPERLLTPQEFKTASLYFPTRTSTSRTIARSFFVLGQPPSVIAEDAEVSIAYVLKVLARFEAAHVRAQAEGPGGPKPTHRRPERLLTRKEFNNTLKYFLTRQGNSQAIAQDFYIKGEAPSAIAKVYGCRVQNVVKVIDRFAAAFERYMEAERNARGKGAKRGEDADAGD